jgi:apolipoprotein D and lipocalin family protein
MSYKNTVDKVEIEKFMGDWFVIAGRVTFLEKGGFNPLEQYKYVNGKIEIKFSFNKDSLTGPIKKIPQTATIIDTETNAYWKVSPFWPLKFDYLVIGLADNYEWTAIGVPSQKYLWIMFRTPHPSQEQVSEVINSIDLKGYDTKNLEYFKHN